MPSLLWLQCGSRPRGGAVGAGSAVLSPLRWVGGGASLSGSVRCAGKERCLRLRIGPFCCRKKELVWRKDVKKPTRSGYFPV